MSWELDGERPIYSQLLEQLQLRIIAGTYQAGQRLPSVRDLAQEAAVNANTMQRALTELEHAGLVHAQRTAGRFITEDQGKIAATRTTFALRHANTYLSGMQKLGYTREESLTLLQEADK
ncbi:MAG: GntR family transcriptional regulator [Clostridia bacterium]|nr:GntR family transcriptional regulator [Clostridia bacterium]